MKIPTPSELLRAFQQIDPSLFMVTIPNLGVVSYGSELHNYGFVVGIDPETGYLMATVGNANIYVPNERCDWMSLGDVFDWFRERFDIWKSIPVEGRTVPNSQVNQGFSIESTDSEDIPVEELDPVVQDIISGKVKNELILPSA